MKECSSGTTRGNVSLSRDRASDALTQAGSLRLSFASSHVVKHDGLGTDAT
jgi:hypothetical protein